MKLINISSFVAELSGCQKDVYQDQSSSIIPVNVDVDSTAHFALNFSHPLIGERERESTWA